jgi:RNA polymerase sigma factor (TIGR02999 family)
MPGQTDDYFARLYDSLRGIARRLMRGERNGITQQPTDLVHDAFPKLHGPWDGESHFLRNAHQQMQWLLIDYARRRRRKKRGGSESARTALHDCVGAEQPYEPPDRDGIERAIAEVEKVSPRAAQVVRLKFYEALTHDEIGERLGVTARTIDRDWRLAAALLLRELEKIYG